MYIIHVTAEIIPTRIRLRSNSHLPTKSSAYTEYYLLSGSYESRAAESITYVPATQTLFHQIFDSAVSALPCPARCHSLSNHSLGTTKGCAPAISADK